jgi:hypothetical protein
MAPLFEAERPADAAIILIFFSLLQPEKRNREITSG